MKCGPRAGQVEVSKLTVCAGLSKDESHGQTALAQHRVQAAGGGGAHCGSTFTGSPERYDLSRQLIRVWIEKYEAGGLDEDAQAADLLHEYETKIPALERLVGRQALEIEFLKGR